MRETASNYATLVMIIEIVVSAMLHISNVARIGILRHQFERYLLT
jgi:hypothetical protein